jgi:poly-gamma-glutamate synthesis protein (capsule biosynthesis protein)
MFAPRGKYKLLLLSVLLLLASHGIAAQRSDTLRLLILGDVMMHQAQLSHNPKHFFQFVRPKMQEADLCIANMEFSLAGEPYSGYPAFSAPDAIAHQLKEDGADIFLLANNHLADKGKSGMLRTLSVYRDSLQMPFTGLNNAPLMIEKKGVRLAFLNFTYGSNAPVSKSAPKLSILSEQTLSEAIDSAHRSQADFLIALPHWGIEYDLLHSPAQEKMARYMSKKGVDAIIGAHPHVVQDTAWIHNVPVIYSVGNAVSNMSAQNTRLELAVELNILVKEKKLLPPTLHWMWCTLPGRLTDSYATIFVEEWIGKRSQWKIPADYDKMMETYQRVKAISLYEGAVRDQYRKDIQKGND